MAEGTHQRLEEIEQDVRDMKRDIQDIKDVLKKMCTPTPDPGAAPQQLPPAADEETGDA